MMPGECLNCKPAMSLTASEVGDQFLILWND